MLRQVTGSILLVLLLAACGPARLPDQISVTLTSDGETRALTLAPGLSVRDALRAASLTLGELDRVRPPETTPLQSGLAITVTRVVQTTEFVTQTLPFETQTVRDANIPSGQTRLQAGRNGVLEVTYRLTYEDGRLVRRDELSREIVEAPVPEILLVGVQGAFSTVPVSGTLAYLSNHNAFAMRDVSGNKRPLTTEGDLDGRVLALSPDGRWLLYSRATTDTLNSLWLVDTTLAQLEPIALQIDGVLWADFSPDGRSIAYSRAEPSPGLPGWKAFNDLQIAPFNAGRLGARREVVAQNSNAPYAWWGTQFAWSPDSKQLAYANTQSIGVISPTARVSRTIPLINFAAYNTRSTWAWTPTPVWSPDNRFVIGTVHAPSTRGESDEDSSVFSVAVALSRTLSAVLVPDAGMWSNPLWLPDGRIVYGQAETPYASEASRYTLRIMDRDGSNARHLFPEEGAVGIEGLPEVAVSPDGRSLLIVYQGDLYLLNLNTDIVRRLTAEGTVSRPRWAK